MPVVTPRRASMLTVNAVPNGALLPLRADCSGSSSASTLLLGERQADEAAAVLGHEVDGLGRDLLGGHDEVALVLAILVVDEDDHLAGADVVDRALDPRDRSHFASRAPSVVDGSAHPPSSFSTYLPIRSTSRFTRAPVPLCAERGRRLRVRDERHREASRASTRVDGQADRRRPRSSPSRRRSARARPARDVTSIASAARRRAVRSRPTPSTCPATMCPPSRSPSSQRPLEVHGAPCAELAEVVRASVSGPPPASIRPRATPSPSGRRRRRRATRRAACSSSRRRARTVSRSACCRRQRLKPRDAADVFDDPGEHRVQTYAVLTTSSDDEDIIAEAARRNGAERARRRPSSPARRRRGAARRPRRSAWAPRTAPPRRPARRR